MSFTQDSWTNIEEAVDQVIAEKCKRFDTTAQDAEGRLYSVKVYKVVEVVRVDINCLTKREEYYNVKR